MPITTYNPAVAAMLPEYEAIRTVLAGPRAVKRGRETYLPRCPGQGTFVSGGRTIDEYLAYVERASPLTYADVFLARLLGAAFRKAPVFTVPASIKPHLRNLSLSAPAESAEAFAKAVVRENVVLGRGGIMVDYDVTAARPYQRMYVAETIVDWEWERVGSQAALSSLRLRETIVEPNPEDPWVSRINSQYKVWRLGADVAPEVFARAPERYALGAVVVETYRQRVDKSGRRSGDFVLQPDMTMHPMRRAEPLWFIPFVPFTPFGLTFDMERPPFGNLTDLIIAHYRNSADYETLLHQCGAGTILFGAGFSRQEQAEPLHVGPGRAVSSENPAASLTYVQTQGQAGAELTTAMENKKREMAVASGRLLMAQSKNVAESGASLELQFSGEDATLQQIVGTSAMALEEAMKIHTWWDGTADTPVDVTDVRVELNDQFLAGRIPTADVIQLATAADAGALTDEDLYWNLLTGERLDPNTTFESWQRTRRGEAGEVEGGSDEDDGTADAT